MFPLITAESLSLLLGKGETVIIDANWYLPNVEASARDEYHQGHIEGAVFFDIDDCCDKQSSLPHMLPSPQKFGEVMQGLGVNRDSHVIVYDRQGYFSAPRLWWMLRYFGHAKVSLLEGGLRAWVGEGLPLQSESSTPKRGDFVAEVNARGLIGKDDILALLGGEDVSGIIIDARSRGRFSGEEAEPRAGLRAGHIPRSYNLPYSECFDSDSGIFKSKPELAALLDRSVGVIDKGMPIICTCGSGVTACVVALALEILGYGEVGIYDGSWCEWGGDSALPLEVGYGRSGRI